MESLIQSDDNFALESDRIRKTVENCDHVFMRVYSCEDDSEIKIKCIKGCGCDNTKGDNTPEDFAFSIFLYENSRIFSNLLSEEIENTDYCKEMEKFIEGKFSSRTTPIDEEEAINSYDEFIKKFLDALNSKFYYQLFEANGRLIDNPLLSEETTVKLYETLSVGNLFSVEDIVKCINSAVPENSASLVHSKGKPQ